jgi:hypothetical protein
VEKVLNHTIDDVAEIYDRHDYSAEKRAALARLGQCLRKTLTDRTDRGCSGFGPRPKRTSSVPVPSAWNSPARASRRLAETVGTLIVLTEYAIDFSPELFPPLTEASISEIANLLAA